MDLLDTHRQLNVQWESLGIDATDLHIDAGGTIVPTQPIHDYDLPLLGDEAEWQVELGEPLGEGGMGLILRGWQRSLAREVAVKTLKPELDIKNEHQLIVEARVAGALEHPNVVPVYALGRSPEGRPLIVM